MPSHAMGKGPDKPAKTKASKPAEKSPRVAFTKGPRVASRTRLSMRAASLGGGVKRKRCRRCIVPFVEDAAQAEPRAEESPPAAKRVKRQARVRTDEEKALQRNPSSCSCSSWDED
jgi:hypothetical protein